MNPYLKNLNKIEFVVTDACTGRCKHCSQGAHAKNGARIDPRTAADAVRKITAAYGIETVMTFGGEPLLHKEAVFAIMRAATEQSISRRQVITNGYFSENADVIRTMAKGLAACGVNDLLLSVDAFHQESIPLETVRRFAAEARACEIPLRLQPAWLVSRTDDNPYNEKTRELLASFADMQLTVGEGNVIFPEGNALLYLSEYFGEIRPENPYEEDPDHVRCVSFSSKGDVLDGNFYQRDVMEILEAYRPQGGGGA